MSRIRLSATFAALTLLMGVLLIIFGVGFRDVPLLVTAVSAQAVSGGYLWRVASQQRFKTDSSDPLELLGMSLALGTGLAALSGALLSLIWPTPLSWFVPIALAIVLWLVRRLRGVRLDRVTWQYRVPTAVGFTVAAVIGILSIAINLIRYPLSGPGPWTTYHQDMLFFEGLSTSAGLFGGSDSIFMAGADIRYHWFAYGWVGQLGQTISTEPFAVLTRVLPLVALLGCAALVVVWTSRLVNRWPATVLAALLLTGGGYLGAMNGTILNFDSPSQNLTTLWLVGALFAAIAYLRGGASWGLLGLVLALIAVTTGGKISSGAVIVAPLMLLALVMILRKDPQRRRALILCVSAIAVAGFIYLAYVSGSASGGELRVLSSENRASSVQGLNSSAGIRGVALGTITLMLAMAARWWGLAWLMKDRSWRWQPEVVIGMGLVLSGLIPVVLLSQGVNETWFALAASAPLAAISAAGVVTAWQAVKNRQALIASLVLAGAVVILVPLVWIPDVIYPMSVRFFGPWIGYGIAIVGGVVVGLIFGGRRWRATSAVVAITVLVVAGSVSRISPLVSDRVHVSSAAGDVLEAAQLTELTPIPDISESESESEFESAELAQSDAIVDVLPGNTAWTSSTVEAAQFLRRQIVGKSIIVTNDFDSFVLPALVPELTFISGAKYQLLYGSAAAAADIPGRVTTSLAFLQSGDTEAFDKLCRAGVEWGWVKLDGTSVRDWLPFAAVEFVNDEVAVIKLAVERCG